MPDKESITEGWFKDDRRGLHCCLCLSVGYKNLYNHKEIKHIVCAGCLPRVKSISKKIIEVLKKRLD